MPDDPRFYIDFTGTGNSLNPLHPSVLRLIMDSLRYWVIECHVDGFRFDLASALAREFFDVDRLSAFFDVIHQDPVLSQVKLIAEPWDVGPGRLPGRQLPGPVVGVERDLPRRDARLLARRGERRPTSPRASPARATSTRPTAATRSRRSTSSPRTTASRCATSSPTTTSTTRPTARTTATAPTTTAPGTAASRATTDDPEILALRARQQRNLLATLLLSQGVPMLLGGDEFGRTQHGNNNAWCQDNELSWYDWEHDDWQRSSRRLHAAADRAAPRAPGLPPPPLPRAATGDGDGLPDVWWFRPDGRRMTQRDWRADDAHVLGVFLNGAELAERTPRRRPDRRRLVPAALQRPPRGRRVPAAQPASGGAGRSSSRP